MRFHSSTKNFLQNFIVVAFLSLSFLSCYPSAEKQDKGTTNREMKLHKHGITIDARYDPRLDNLIPGYKIMTIGLTNSGYDVLRLNTLKDHWEIVDAWGRKQKAIHSLRVKDPHTFVRLPDKLQQMVEYPVGVSVGYSETIDLFFPKDTDLKAFRAVSFYSAERKMTYDVLNNFSSPTHVPINEGNPQEIDPSQLDPRFAPK
ncbi:MAG: hypothetical protein H7A32_04115 [Deltaproteobacteria bacterium]|nr:hypothetical protein [Deltaproteobacteria bacterium]